MKKQSSWFVSLGIVVIGLILRIPFTTIPTVLSTIAADLNVSVSSLGMVTTIPLLMFALCSSLAPSVARKVGLERLFALILLVMTLGSAMRIINLPFLYLGTLLIGGSISFLNVLLPSAVSAYFPDKIGPLTTAYTTSMGIASALMSTIAVPMVKVTSWRFLIIFLSAGILLALLLWLPNLRNQERFDGKAKPLVSSVWSNKRAWIILLFGGAQSLLFYTGMTWLPTMATEAGLNQTTAGLLAGLYSLIGLPLSVLIPTLVTKLSQTKRQLVMLGFTLLGLVGVTLLLFQSSSVLYWTLVNLLIGASAGALFPFLMVTFSMKTASPQEAAQLSGMVQTGGYLLAAVGPTAFGLAYSWFGSWMPAVVLWIAVTLLMVVTLYQLNRFDKI